MSVWFSIVSGSLLYIYFLSKDILRIAYIKYANQLESTTPTHIPEWEKDRHKIRQRRYQLGRRKNNNFLEHWFKVSLLTKNDAMNLFIIIKQIH